MDFFLNLNKGITSILIVLISYFIYYISGYTKLIKVLFGINKNAVSKIIYQKFNGGFILGGVPLVFILIVMGEPLSKYGVNFGNMELTAILALIFGFIVWIVSRYYSVKPSNQAKYPEIRLTKWTKPIFLLSSCAWAIYLLGYELMFRGYLLFSCLMVFDIYTSVTINTLIYALVHIHKGWVETAASVPMGIVMCTLVIITGNIWVPFLVHLILAVSNDYYSIKANRDMVFK